MSDNPSGSLWVSPEGVSRVGNAYQQQIALYESHLHRLESLRQRYRSAWGDDSMGKQFQEQFDPLIDTLRDMITGVIGTLEFTAKGLRTGGESYQRADEDASTGSRKLNVEFGQALSLTQPAKPVEDGEEPLQRTAMVELMPLRKTFVTSTHDPDGTSRPGQRTRLRYGVCIPERPALRLERGALLDREAPRSLLAERIRLRPTEHVQRVALQPAEQFLKPAEHDEPVTFQPAEHNVVVSGAVEGTVTAPEETFRRLTEPETFHRVTEPETFRRVTEPIPGEPRD